MELDYIIKIIVFWLIAVTAIYLFYVEMKELDSKSQFYNILKGVRKDD